MRSNKFIFILTLLTLVAGFSASAATELYQPNYWKNMMTNGAVTLTNGVSTNLSTRVFPITVRQGVGLAIFVTVRGNLGVGTSNAVLTFEATYDKTNWTTTGPLRVTNVLTSTTNVVGLTIIPPAQLDNVRQIRLSDFTHWHTNAVVLSNCVYSYKN